jgi:hypothetical protein
LGLVEKLKSPFLRPEGINFIVAGGGTNPIVHTTDYVHYKIASVDKWIPEGGIKLDKKPLRMPAWRRANPIENSS